MKTANTTPEVIEAIVDVNTRSAAAKELAIFEIGSLNDLIPLEKAEHIRKQLQTNKTYVRQLTNLRKLEAWTQNEPLVKRQRIKYVNPEVFAINNEILIFEDTVAIYRLKPSPLYLEITDAMHADSMRAIFDNLWLTGNSLLLTPDGSSLSKQYLPLNSEFDGVPVVIYPAKDDGVLTKAFDRAQSGCIEDYVRTVLQQDAVFASSADMIIAVVWNQDATPYCDVWKVNRNTYSDDSGFLYDVRVHKGLDVITDMGVASGNTSIVLTAEEMLLRELIIAKRLPFKEAANRAAYQARFPVGYVPDEVFYISLA